MADYYTHFSCILPLADPAQLDAALACFETFKQRLRADEDRSPGFIVSLPAPCSTGIHLWLYEDGYAEPDDVINFIAELGPALALKGLWGFEWSHTCSKPRIDAFGGGACVIDLASGETIGSISTNEWLTRTLADPYTAGEA